MVAASDMHSGLSAPRLREILDYDPVTGIFRWQKSLANGRQKGDVAGCLLSNGYIHVTVLGHIYLAHRLAWFYMTGEWPPQLDHRDRNKSNNRFDNLRKATHGQNQRNKHLTKASGLPCGVRKQAGRNNYRAYIKHNKKIIHLGMHATPGEAHLAYLDAARDLGVYEFLPE